MNGISEFFKRTEDDFYQFFDVMVDYNKFLSPIDETKTTKVLQSDRISKITEQRFYNSEIWWWVALLNDKYFDIINQDDDIEVYGINEINRILYTLKNKIESNRL